MANRFCCSLRFGLAAMILAGSPAIAAPALLPPRLPFPHHTAYAGGTILPAQPREKLDAATAEFYQLWKAKYLRKLENTATWYVFINPDGEAAAAGKSPDSISVSEGHGYGMLIAATFAGLDPEAREIFDGLYGFFRAHPTTTSPDLMAWLQLKGGRNSKDADSATDGDLDIAYALLLADAQWGSDGPINYLAQARAVIAAIGKEEMHPTAHFPRLGSWAATSARLAEGTRTSDFMPQHFRAFASATAEPAWLAAVDGVYGLTAAMQAGPAKASGLLPDFIASAASKPVPAKAHYLEGKLDGAYSWNACRVPWRLGTDYLLTGEPRAREALAKLTRWARTATREKPGAFRAGYQLSGKPAPGSDEASLAFIAPLGVAAMADRDNQKWLDDIWAFTTAQKLADSDYYGNSIKMLCLMVISGNWLDASLPPSGSPLRPGGR